MLLFFLQAALGQRALAAQQASLAWLVPQVCYPELADAANLSPVYT